MRGTSLSGGDPALLRRLNTQATLSALRGSEPLTVAQLSRLASLSRQTVEAVLSDLSSQGWVEEGPPEKGMGRPARRYRFRSEAGYVLGIDVGVHKVLAVAADLSGQEVATHRAELPAPLDGAERLDLVRGMAETFVADQGIPRDRVLGLCIGVPGIVDRSGRVRVSTPLPDWSGLDLAQQAGRWFGAPASAENDANLATLAEHWRGAARFTDDCVYVLTGHRTGAGLLLGGRIHRGRGGAAGEIGALKVLGWEDDGAATLRETGDAQKVFIAAAAGDDEAQGIVRRFARGLAQGAAALILTVNPDLLVIGGGYSRAGETLAEPLRAQLSELCLDPPHVALSTLGEESVAIGAVRLALDRLDADLFGTVGMPAS